MKNLFRNVLVVLMLTVGSLVTMAQERQVEVNVDTPIRKSVTTDDLKLGGKLYLPAFDGRMFVESEISYVEGFNQLVNPADVMQASGKAWVFLTPKVADGPKTRPFVLGGMTQTFVSRSEDATQVNMGFGIFHERGNGFAFAPSVEYNTNDVAGRSVLGKEIDAKFRFFIPAGKQFRVNITPYASRFEILGTASYANKYGVTVGVARVF